MVGKDRYHDTLRILVTPGRRDLKQTWQNINLSGKYPHMMLVSVLCNEWKFSLKTWNRFKVATLTPQKINKKKMGRGPE